MKRLQALDKFKVQSSRFKVQRPKTKDQRPKTKFALILVFALLVPFIAVAQSQLPPVAISFTQTVPNVGISLIQFQTYNPSALPVTFNIVQSPAHGRLAGFNPNSGVVTYTPNANYTGIDTVQYSVTSGAATSATATVTLTVTNQKTTITDKILDLNNNPRTGTVTFVLTQPVTSPAGITPVSSVSAVTNAQGQFSIQVYPSTSLSPQSFYQVYFASSSTPLNPELQGVYNIPASNSPITLSPYKVSDTNLAGKYAFTTPQAVKSMIDAAIANAQLSGAGVSSFNTRMGDISLLSGDVAGALGFTPEHALTFTGAGVTRTGDTVTIPGGGGAGLDGVTVTTDAQLANEITNNTPLVNISGTITLTANRVIPAVMTLRFLSGSKIATGSNTLTILGSVSDTMAQLFDTTGGGSVQFFSGTGNSRAFSALRRLRPEWWGISPVFDANKDDYSSIQAAINALGGQGSVLLDEPVYELQRGVVTHDNYTLLEGRGATKVTINRSSQGGNGGRIGYLYQITPALQGMTTTASLATGAGAAYVMPTQDYINNYEYLVLNEGQELRVDGLSEFSVECFLRPATTPANIAIIMATSARTFYGDTTNAPGVVGLYQNTNNSLHVEVNIWRGGVKQLLSIDTPANSLPIQTTHHIAVVFSVSNSALTVYLDGVAQGAVGLQAGDTLAQEYLETWTLGALVKQNPEGALLDVLPAMQGAIDSLRLSNTARDTANFTPPTAKHTLDSATLGLWNFDKLYDSNRIIKNDSYNGGGWYAYYRRGGNQALANNIKGSGAKGLIFDGGGFANGIFSSLNVEGFYDVELDSCYKGLTLWNNNYLSRIKHLRVRGTAKSGSNISLWGLAATVQNHEIVIDDVVMDYNRYQMILDSSGSQINYGWFNAGQETIFQTLAKTDVFDIYQFNNVSYSDEELQGGDAASYKLQANVALSNPITTNFNTCSLEFAQAGWRNAAQGAVLIDGGRSVGFNGMRAVANTGVANVIAFYRNPGNGAKDYPSQPVAVDNVSMIEGVGSSANNYTQWTTSGESSHVTIQTNASGGGSPAGSNTQVQFNNNGVFGASPNFTFNGNQLFAQSGSASVTPLVVKHAASPGSNAFSVQDSSGTNQVYVDNSFNLRVNQNLGIGTNPLYPLHLYQSSNGAATAMFQGAIYGTVVKTGGTTVDQYAFHVDTGVGNNQFYVGGNGYSGFNTSTPNAQVEIDSSGASVIPLIFKHAAAPTVDFTQWRNSANTPVLAVNSIGALQTKTASNTDLAGQLTLSSGSASYTFTGIYTSAPVCVATDTTAANAVKISVTATGLTISGNGSDVINYICVGRN